MHLISINVGLPQALSWKDQTATTSIVKKPVEGPVFVHTLHLEGDAQANLTVHGGVTKAVYGYPLEHYAYWESELNKEHLPPGSFGENLTIDGLKESDTQIGDRFQIGKVVLMATEPRQPCDKLAMRMQQEDMIERFLYSLRSGVYFSVLKEGMIQAGDEVKCIHKEQHGITVSDIIRLDVIDRNDEEGLRKAIKIDALPEKWKKRFRSRVEAKS